MGNNALVLARAVTIAWRPHLRAYFERKSVAAALIKSLKEIAGVAKPQHLSDAVE